jgi:hypothetical protein
MFCTKAPDIPPGVLAFAISALPANLLDRTGPILSCTYQQLNRDSDNRCQPRQGIAALTTGKSLLLLF